MPKPINAGSAEKAEANKTLLLTVLFSSKTTCILKIEPAPCTRSGKIL